MKKQPVLTYALTAVVASSAALAGCAGDQATNADAHPTQEFHYYLTGEPSTLDPSKVNDGGAAAVMGQIYEGLTRIQDGKPVPGVANSWEVSPDGLHYTFHLKEQAQWADGSPVTARDFEYSWKRTLNPSTQSPYAFVVAWIKGGMAYNQGKGSAEDVGVKAVDAHTLEVTLEHPIPFFLEQMAFAVFYPEKQEFVEKAGEKFGSASELTLSNGPFTLSDWSHEHSVEVTKSSTYEDREHVKLEKATWQIVSDSETLENLYQTNLIDGFVPVKEQVARYKDTPEYHVLPDLSTGYLQFNEKEKVLQNANVRKALTYGFDAAQYVEILLNNGSTPAVGVVPTGTSDGQGGDFRKDNGDLLQRAAKGKDAKQLLQQGLQEVGLTSAPKLTLLIPEGSKAGEFLQSQWKQNLGLDVDVEPLPRKLLLKREASGDYQVALSNWGADYNDPMTFLDMFTSDSPLNQVHYGNPAYDKLIQEAVVEADAAVRKQKLQEAERLLVQDMPIAPIYFAAKPQVLRTYVKGWNSYPSFPEYSLKYVWIDGK